MKTYKNDDGFDVYEIKTISDFKELPEDCLDDALETFKIWISGLDEIIDSMAAIFNEFGADLREPPEPVFKYCNDGKPRKINLIIASDE